jgi:lipoate-protein ligase A
MKCHDVTFPTPEENLACDEVLLDMCEAGGDEALRFWEPTNYFVVVGYANQTASEVHLDWCRQARVPVLRRCSGGGTVLQGPGCLNYSVAVRLERSETLQSISGANCFILERHQQALAALLGQAVETQGHTDLAVAGLKFSGNAQRRKRQALLFHGSFLLNFHLDLIEKALPMPSKEPAYRQGRSHTEFLMNLKVPAEQVKRALLKAWHATVTLETIPMEPVAHLVRDRYGCRDWNFRL